MSRKYLTDIDITDNKGVTTTYGTWVSLKCNYCWGTGSETRLSNRMVKEDGEVTYTRESVPCRCLKYVKKEQKDEPENPPTNL